MTGNRRIVIPGLWHPDQRKTSEGRSVVSDGLEFRCNENGTLDEIVGLAFVHLEQMEDRAWWMSLSSPARPDVSHHVNFWSKRSDGRIRVFVETDDADGISVGEHSGGIFPPSWPHA